MTKDIYVFNTKKNASIYLHGAIENQATRQRIAYLDFYRPVSAMKRLEAVLSEEDLAGLEEMEILSIKGDRKFYVSGLKSVATGLLMNDHWAIIEDKGDDVLVLHIKYDGIVYEGIYLQPGGANQRFIGFINDVQTGMSAYGPMAQSDAMPVGV